MPSYQVKQSSTAYPLVFLMVDSSDHVSAKTGLTCTVTISKAGGSFASPSGAVTEIANGWYKVAGNATDTATLGPLVLHSTATGADPCDALYEVVAHDVQDSVRLGLSAVPNAAASASGGLPTLNAGLAVKADLDTIKTQAVTCAAGVTVPTSLASPTNITAGTITTVTTVTNQLTAAQIATGVWQDATAGDFTTASSIGKCLYISNVAPGAAGGHFIAGTNAATTITTGLTTTFTGNLTGSVGSVTGAVGSVTGAVGSVTGLTTSTIATAVWQDATAGDFTVASSIGKSLYTAGAVPGAAGGLFIAGTNAATTVTTAFTTTFTGSLTGSVASVTGAVGSVTGLTTATIAAAAWDLATSGHTTAGTFGEAMSAAGSAGDPWTTALPGAYSSGTAGYLLGNNADTAGTTTLLSRIGGAITISGGGVNVNLTQAVPTSNTAQTIGDCYNAARAQGFGKWAISGTTLNLYASDGTTVVRAFTLDSSTAPTSRT